MFGYDLVRKRKSHLTIEDHLPKLLSQYSINVVIDVGANLGQYGEELRSQGFTGHIFSFEPTEYAFSHLEKRSKNDPKWHIFNYALGNENKKEKIHETSAVYMSSFLEPNENCKKRFSHTVDIKNERLVDIKTLNSIYNELIKDIPNPRIFLKMDTQGYDLNVFKGALDCLSNIDLIVSEMSVRPLYQGMPNHIESLTEFESQGYVPTGMFPVCRDDGTQTIIEYDCVFAKLQNDNMDAIQIKNRDQEYIIPD